MSFVLRPLQAVRRTAPRRDGWPSTPSAALQSSQSYLPAAAIEQPALGRSLSRCRRRPHRWSRASPGQWPECVLRSGRRGGSCAHSRTCGAFRPASRSHASEHHRDSSIVFLVCPIDSHEGGKRGLLILVVMRCHRAILLLGDVRKQKTRSLWLSEVLIVRPGNRSSSE